MAAPVSANMRWEACAKWSTYGGKHGMKIMHVEQAYMEYNLYYYACSTMCMVSTLYLLLCLLQYMPNMLLGILLEILRDAQNSYTIPIPALFPYCHWESYLILVVFLTRKLLRSFTGALNLLLGIGIIPNNLHICIYK